MTPSYKGIEMFSPDMVFIRKVFNSNGHKDVARLEDGTPVLVITNANEKPVTLPDFPNGIVVVDLTTGKQWGLVALSWVLAVHISCCDRGFAFIETFRDPGSLEWPVHADELFRVSLKDDPILRLAHHRSLIGYQGDYVSQPKLSVSRDGSKLVWASNFDAPPNSAGEPSRADVYMTKGIK